MIKCKDVVSRELQSVYDIVGVGAAMYAANLPVETLLNSLANNEPQILTLQCEE
ncbi:hypothetical protein P7K49_027745, partial [Saguinus oedipus]